MDQLGVDSRRLFCLEGFSSELLVTEERWHGLFRSILILLDTLLLRLLLDLGYLLLGRGGYTIQISELMQENGS